MENRLLECMEALEYTFENPALLEQALTHSSYAMAMHRPGTDNERLEYLGDAALELIVSRYLYAYYPTMQEGGLTRTRAGLVCEESLYRAALELGLDKYLLLGHGEEAGGGRKKPSILSDAFEAVLCAVYLDGGLEEADKLVKRTVLVPGRRQFSPQKDNKTALQEFVQHLYKNAEVRYELLEESGPDHQKIFRMQVCINGKPMGEGTGHSKQSAGQEAAHMALSKLQNQHS